MYYAEGPGLYTDQLNPFETNGLTWPYLVGVGYEWATFQCYNPRLQPVLFDYPLQQVKDHHFKNVGVWGVIYDLTDFYNGGKESAKQAVKMEAQHLIINAEMCMKNTRADRKAKRIIDGCRDGGWTGPVDLVTLGTPSDPVKWDFEMDFQSFLETGGSIQCEAFYNDDLAFTPKNCAIYWERLGVPLNRLNQCIGLYKGARGEVNGAEWVNLLKDAAAGRAFSVYMAQHGMKDDYEALATLTKVTAPQLPPPVTPMTSAETKAAMIKLADTWLNTQSTPQTLSRIKIAKTILQTDDVKWNAIRENILRELA